ncbi:hypothetical protein VNO78_10704 [Psophocarpus tetragonolobus]|uniref:Ethylene insensitive 3-like DNA-binding domain-containing protein n=1 Tax=Psophocarpus tetragonolobus TaxID=3891 RepID=A0AAN9XMZ8_PSOTE
MVEIREETNPFDEEEKEEEEIDYDQLKQRMWRDRILLQKLKEKRPKDEPQQEASRRKKLSRAQDSILKYMVKIMQVCNAQGFVYGIVPEKGKPVTGSSDSLRERWKQKGNKNECESSTSTVIHEGSRVAELNDESNLGGRIEKRKSVFDLDTAVDKLYACQYSQCPESEMGMGFPDKNSRMNHESLCAYRPNQSQPVLYDYQSNDTQITSLDDWMNMEVVRDNQNEDLVGHLMNDQLRDTVGKTPQDYGGLWLNSLEDLEWHAALNQMNTDLNTNPEQDTTQGQEITSIWELTYK